MTRKPKTGVGTPNSMQVHTDRIEEAAGEETPTKPRSSTKPGGYLVHPNAAGKVGSVPVKPNPRGKKK